MTATPTETISYLEEDKASVFTYLGLTWAKTIHLGQTSWQQQSLCILGGQGEKEVEVMRLKCKGGEKYKNKDRRRLGQLQIKRKSYFFPSVGF